MPAPARPLQLDADLARLADVRRHVRERAAELGADGRCVDDLVVAVDEWVTNVIRHGYGGGQGAVEVLVMRDGDQVAVRVRDEAPLFDPATAPPFDPTVPLEQRPLGGMGIHLMRELTDGMEHRIAPGGGNELVLRRALRAGTMGGQA
jgi:serine/threonine-protein kinase RsbW